MGEATERIDFSYCGEKIADENIINARLGVGRDPDVQQRALLLRRKITENPDTLKSRARVWYVSRTGKPDNDGKTPETAWDSLETLEKNNPLLQSGDAVLFRRGDIFRGCVTSVSGVGYGAYGTGEKPRIYGSSRDYIGDRWYRTEDGLWTVDCEFPADIGNIVFDNGRAVGVKCINKADIKNPFDYWCDLDGGNRIYIMLDRHPAEMFESVEILHNLWMFRLDKGVNDVRVENIAFAYCGGHGIRAGGVENVSVIGCEFRFIGGCFLTGFGDGTVRYGNAVEFMSGAKNITVKNCFMHQIYDSGITHQGYGDYRAVNIHFTENLIEYCGMGSIEYWLGQDSKCIDIFYEDNILRFAGYGFGGIQRRDKNMTAHIQSNGACLNDSENFVIRNNIFENSTYDLVNAQSKMKTPPVLIGNTYIQTKNARLGSYSENLDCLFDGSAEKTVKEIWGDTFAYVKKGNVVNSI